jgi:hypothetical protein
VELAGAAELQRVIRAAPTDLKKAMRATGKVEVGDPLALYMRQREQGAETYGLYLAPSIRAVKANMPTIKMGGKKKAGIGDGRARLADIIYGAEFGSHWDSTSTYTTRKGTTVTRHTKRQFRPARRGGYEFFRSFNERGPQIIARWYEVFREVERKWNRVDG